MLTFLHDFPRIAAAINAYQQGLPVLLLDDNYREDEADIVAAAENISIETMALMIREGSGIVCLCLTEQIADELALMPMVANNQSRYQTAFTVSIEAKEGVSTGVSAKDRVTTIQAALSSNDQHRNIVSPGHIFPLRARQGGVLERRGHTEGSVDIAWLAGLKPAAVLCELTNADGTMAKGQQVEDFAKLHNIPILTIEELVQYFLLIQTRQTHQQPIAAKSVVV
ncbi:3,4-dihydroxy-2-butanone-4-phosphate synthase [Entomomonas asaccharolytica]|uniref:3,4-dihydroxy-2-butanone 4-phosphate synthase n=1 Tax=Entomomonas asaccharolytica TaxID=2785331 RepID=A0A974RYG1_9GAMM|nr:3,4-dihydroxy-2-butanone-4-phosphate synthase [Entomomonas asaccharolytica]QQP85849.1 3,4-dihydroxy-2-butanone-4-phosphate synthase [Entomomonas asaccharolytica]